METKEITKTVYIANDGKEFLSKEDCEKYEKFVNDILSNIKYFCISCHPDLTETGYFTHKIYVSVFSKYYLHYEIVFEYALRRFKCYLGEGVQGYRFQPHFGISEVSKEEYENCPPTKWGCSMNKSEKVLLSTISVEGFPENIDYMKEWGFK